MSDSNADSASLERRKSRRVNIALPVEIRDDRGFSLHSAQNVSLGGFYLDRAIPHPIGARVVVALQLPGDDRQIVCDAEIANVPDGTQFGMGVRFVSLAQPDRQRLEAFLRDQERR